MYWLFVAIIVFIISWVHEDVIPEIKSSIKNYEPPKQPSPEDHYVIVNSGDFKYRVHDQAVKPHATVLSHIGFDKVDTLYVPDNINGVPVTCIANECFMNNRLVNTVVLPDTVNIIGKNAFSRCSVNKVVLGKNISYILDEAFYLGLAGNDIYRKIEINLPSDKGLYIGKSAFANVKINNFTLSNKHSCVYGSFSRASITNLTINGNAKKLCEGQFWNSSIKTVKICDGITAIPKECFKDCSSLYKIQIPDSVKIIDESAFNIDHLYSPSKSDGSPDLRYNPSCYTGANENIIFYCSKGSVAQAYAQKYGMTCRPFDEFEDEIA